MNRNHLVKVSFSVFVLVASSLMFPVRSYANLSTPQIGAIISVLQSFGVDSATIASVRADLAGTPVSPSSSAPAYTFTRDLKEGSKGSDVKHLQEILNTHGCPVSASGPGSLGKETMHFGPLTTTALICFQRQQHITPAVGYFGPLTRNIVETLLAQQTISSVHGTNGTETQSASSASTTTPPIVTGVSGGGGGGGGSVGGGVAVSGTTPPGLTLSGPTGLIKADLAQTLYATTTENATCAYATSSVPFASMTHFTTTGGTVHSTILWNTPYGSSVTYHVKCEDAAGNVSNDVTDSFSTTAFPLQTTLASFGYYTSDITFKDLMFQSVGWQTSGYAGNGNGGTCNASSITRDADGYPTSSLSGTGCKFSDSIMLHMPQGSSLPPNVPYPWPSGQYVLTYDGSGTVSISGPGITVSTSSPGRIVVNDTAPGDVTSVSITSTDPTNYVHNIHVVLSSDASVYQTQPFQQRFLDALAPYSILRTMDWAHAYSPPSNLATFSSGITQVDTTHLTLPSGASSTDGAYAGRVALVIQNGHWDYYWISAYAGATRTITLASPLYWTGSVTTVNVWNTPANATWASRASTDPLMQQTSAGIAYEYWIDLANETQKNLWVNIPYAADDNFITQLATMLKNNLDPNLKIYIEYGNENWWEPGSGAWCEAKGMALGFGDGLGGEDAYSAYRSLQIFHIFDQVFGENDLHVDRNPASDRLVRILSSQTASVSRSQGVMDWQTASTTAFSYGHKAYEYADVWAATDYFNLAGGVVASTTPIDQLLVSQKQAINGSTGSNSSLYLLAQSAQARALKLVQYEGGEGLTVPDGNSNTVNKLTSMMRDPAMKAVYALSLYNWGQLALQFPGVIGDWAQFDNTGAGSKYGFWGMIETVMQTPANVPRYQPLLDFVNGTFSVDLTPPSAPATVTATASSTPGVVDLSWSSSTDNVGIRDYNIYRNGVVVGTTTQTSYVDSGLSTATTYTYTVKAVDTSVNFSTSSPTASVLTSGPDLTPPAAAILDPSVGATVSGASVKLTATSTDNVAIANVQFKVGNTPVAAPITATSSVNTYTTFGNFTGFADGTTTLNAVAEDTSGNYATTSISILINNTQTPSTNLVGYWPFDASTTDWTALTTLDESGYGNTGHIQGYVAGNATSTTGVFGQALTFNTGPTTPSTGVAGYVALASTTATSINTNFTLSAWIRSSNAIAGQTIVSNGQNYTGPTRYKFSVDANYLTYGYTIDNFSVSDASTTVSLAYKNYASPATFLNTWHFLTVSSDQTTMYVYWDGKLVSSKNRSTVGSGFANNTNPFFAIGAGATNGGYFFGSIDDVRMYNRVLSSSQVLQLYDQSK